MRVFFAIPVDWRVEEECLRVIDTLKIKGFQAAWTKKGNFHVTVLFLGEQTPAFVQTLCNAVENNLQVTSFDWSTQKIGFFKKSGTPTVVWAGLEASSGLEVFLKGFRKILQPFSVEIPENFQPHITLGRIKCSPTDWLPILQGIQHSKIEFHVSEFTLFQSTLRAQGAEYTVIKNFQFTKMRTE